VKSEQRKAANAPCGNQWPEQVPQLWPGPQDEQEFPEAPSNPGEAKVENNRSRSLPLH